MSRAIATLFGVMAMISGTLSTAQAERSTQVRVSAGLAAASFPEQYDGAIAMPYLLLVGGAGLDKRLSDPVSGTLDVTYALIGSGTFVGVSVPENSHRTDPSSVVAATAGIKIDGEDLSDPTPFVSAALGIARVGIGDLKIESMLGPTTTIQENPSFAPAFAMGVGFQSGSAYAGPRVSMNLRWICVLARGGSINLFPVVLGVAF